MPALLFGSISTLADTSELQRAAFNQAFSDHGLDWSWSQAEYRTLLDSNGGAGRIEAYARERGETVDAEAVHASKSKIFQQSLASSPVTARAGVAETLRAARDAGYKLGFVTTTSSENVSALLTTLAPEIGSEVFDVVTSSTEVPVSKPDPAAYQYALRALDVAPGDCVAVEDNPGGVRSAAAAGVACVAFPNVNTAQLDFGPADQVVDRLAFEDLRVVGSAEGSR